MLVLSRKEGERIWVGDEVCVDVVQIGQGRVRLGLTAPQALHIVRAELLPADDPRQRRLPFAASEAPSRVA